MRFYDRKCYPLRLKFCRKKSILFRSTLSYSKAYFLTVEKRSCLHNVYDTIRFHSSVAFFLSRSKIRFPYMEKDFKNQGRNTSKLTKLNNFTQIFLQGVYTTLIIIIKYSF